MKKLKLWRNAFLALSALTLIAVGCDDEDQDPIGSNSIAAQVVSNPDFSILASAVTRAGLAEALSGGDLTVFAPDNAAFTASGLDAAAVNGLDPATLTAILQHHVIGRSIASGSLPEKDQVETLLTGSPVQVSKGNYGVLVNGIKVKAADLPASNGVIHVIEKVLIPPAQTIAEIAASDPDNFSLLVAAVQKAGLLNAVSQPGNFTVFAPTNAAFQAAGFNTVDDINNAPTDLITTVVRYHVLGQKVFAGELTDGIAPATIQGGTVTINLNPARIKVTGSANPSSNIVLTDILATNGVIHVVDRVILP